MHFQWAHDRWSHHVGSGRGLCWNYVTPITTITNITDSNHKLLSCIINCSIVYKIVTFSNK